MATRNHFKVVLHLGLSPIHWTKTPFTEHVWASCIQRVPTVVFRGSARSWLAGLHLPGTVKLYHTWTNHIYRAVCTSTDIFRLCSISLYCFNITGEISVVAVRQSQSSFYKIASWRMTCTRVFAKQRTLSGVLLAIRCPNFYSALVIFVDKRLVIGWLFH